jgi:hypothetical protein
MQLSLMLSLTLKGKVMDRSVPSNDSDGVPTLPQNRGGFVNLESVGDG